MFLNSTVTDARFPDTPMNAIATMLLPTQTPSQLMEDAIWPAQVTQPRFVEDQTESTFTLTTVGRQRLQPQLLVPKLQLQQRLHRQLQLQDGPRSDATLMLWEPEHSTLRFTASLALP